MKRTALLWIATQTILLMVAPLATVSGSQKGDTPLQRFICNTGYTLEQCVKDITVLRRTLAKYPVAQLGEWTWILVLPRGLDPDSPAFTFYLKRETFIEEALVTEVPVRGRELLLKWNMSVRDLLDFAIAHELGHALCNDKDEWNANRVGQLLREGKASSCGANLEAKIRAGKIRKTR